MKVIIFEGENSDEYFRDPAGEYYYQFQNRITEEYPENNEQDQWLRKLLIKINNQELAFISDQAYVDYQFATKSYAYPNLYRSANNQLTMPYFLPVTYHNSPEHIRLINKM